MPFQGKVNLTNPDTVLSLIEYYGICPKDVPDKPYKVGIVGAMKLKGYLRVDYRTVPCLIIQSRLL